jgi:hypothetical protein
MDMSSHIDQQLVNLLAVATQPPAIVRPYLDIDNDFERVRKNAQQHISNSIKEFKAWEKLISKIKLQINDLFIENIKSVDRQQIHLLEHYATVFEKKSENLAIDLNKFQKQNKYIIREASQLLSDEKARLIHADLENASSIMYEEIDANIEFASFFRALAAKVDPDQEITFTANSAEDIDDYFKSLETH